MFVENQGDRTEPLEGQQKHAGEIKVLAAKSDPATLADTELAKSLNELSDVAVELPVRVAAAIVDDGDRVRPLHRMKGDVVDAHRSVPQHEGTPTGRLPE